MTLPHLLRARLAFDVEHYKREALRLHNIERNDCIEKRWINVGVQFENARLQPLFEQMIACVEALENLEYFYFTSENRAHPTYVEHPICNCVLCQIRPALAALSVLVREK